MKKTTILFFLIFISSCTNTKQESVKDELKIRFHPSFDPSLDFILTIEKVNYKVYDHRKPPSSEP